jgi:hypothetical protein
VGVAVAAAGGSVLGTLANRRHDDAQELAPIDRGRAMDLQRQAYDYAHWANVALFTGGVVAVAGIVWGLVARHR